MNYKFRMHDTRIGRFFRPDPLASQYPHNSSYAFSENRVIDGVELEGLEFYHFQTYGMPGTDGSVNISMVTDGYVQKETYGHWFHNITGGAFVDKGAMKNVAVLMHEGIGYYMSMDELNSGEVNIKDLNLKSAKYFTTYSVGWLEDASSALGIINAKYKAIPARTKASPIAQKATQKLDNGPQPEFIDGPSNRSVHVPFTKPVKPEITPMEAPIKEGVVDFRDAAKRIFVTNKDKSRTWDIHFDKTAGRVRVKERIDNPNPDFPGKIDVKFNKYGVPKGSQKIKGERSGNNKKRTPTPSELKLYNEKYKQ